MDEDRKLIAKNDRQLGTCLRYLFAKEELFVVTVNRAENGKVYFAIEVFVEPGHFDELKNEYEILIS